MKKTAIIMSILCFCLYTAEAQDIGNIVTKDNNFRNSLWIHTDNSASLAFNPILSYNDLLASYNLTTGDYHSWRQPGTRNELGVKTSGATFVGKFLLCGEFSFDNIFDSGLRGNAIMYEVPEDMPYYVLDTTSSRWNRQVYDMNFRLTSPVLYDHISLGIIAGYTSKVGAKQNDPRAESFVTELRAVPSVSYRFLGKHIIGLSGAYNYLFERSEPSNNNYHINRIVYLTRGLGEGSPAKVGGNDGLKEYYYKGYIVRGSLDYGYTGSFSISGEIGVSYKDINVMHQVSLPKNMGQTGQMSLYSSVKALFGKNKSNHIRLDAEYRNTDGIEKIQVRDDTPMRQKWVVVAENNMSSYIHTRVSASYDHQFNAGDRRGFDWNIGGNFRYESEEDEYFAPASSFNWTNLFASVFGAKQFKFNRSELLAKLSAGYLHGADGDYLYSGDSNTLVVQKFWQEELEFRNKSSMDFACRLSYTLHSGRVNYVFDLNSEYMTGYRLVTGFAFGIIF